MYQTSEFWVGLATVALAAIGSYLEMNKILTHETWIVIQTFLISQFTYVVGRIISKIVKR